MAGLTVHFEVLNQLNTPTLYADTLALRPAPAIKGRIFFRTDSPYGIYRDTGTAWDLIASPDTTGISGSGAAGQVSYFTGASTIGGNNNLFWDSVNSRLGIKTTTPGVELDIHGTGTVAHFNGTGTSNAFVNFQSAGVNEWRIGNNYSGGTNYFSIFDQTNSGEIVKIESGTTALNGINTLNAASFNNYTLTGIAAATAINNNKFTSNYTFNSGITRTTIAEIGTSVNANMTFSGAFTKSNDGQQSGFAASLNFTLSGNFTQNQPGTYLQTPTSIQSGATFTGAFTVSHFSNTRLAPWISATPTTITNAYQLVINNLSAFSGSSLSPTYTNRWGIYQDGASDNNYFAGKIITGSTTVSTFQLDVTGTARVTGAATFSGNVVLGTTALSGGGSAQWITTNGTTYGGGLISSVSGVVKAYYYYDNNANAALVQGIAGVGVELWANAAVALSIATTGTATFSSSVKAGGGTTNASAILQADSTTKGFLLPRMTTTQKNAIATPAQGLMVFDTTLVKLCVYSGTTWETITSV